MCLCWPGVEIDHIESTPNGRKVTRTTHIGYIAHSSRYNNSSEKRSRSSRHRQKGSDEFSSSRALHNRRKDSEEGLERPSSPQQSMHRSTYHRGRGSEEFDGYPASMSSVQPPMQEISRPPPRHQNGMQYPQPSAATRYPPPPPATRFPPPPPAAHAVPSATPLAVSPRGPRGDPHGSPTIVDATPAWEVASPTQVGVRGERGVVPQPMAPHSAGPHALVPRPPAPHSPSHRGAGGVEGGNNVRYAAAAVRVPRPPRPAPPPQTGHVEPGLNLGRRGAFEGPRIGLPRGMTMRARQGSTSGIGGWNR
jgi:hypothetical protein